MGRAARGRDAHLLGLQVDTGDAARGQERFGSVLLGGEHDEPLAALALDADGLDLADHHTVLVDLDVPDALETDPGNGVGGVEFHRQPSPSLGKSTVSNQFTPRKRG